MKSSIVISWLRFVATALVICCCVGSTARADVLVVDAAGLAGSDFTDLPAAIASAAQGDILLVRDGIYSGFTLGKGLVITAESGAKIQLSGSLVVEGLPPGSTATLIGFIPTLQPGTLDFVESRLELRSNEGAVFVRDSTFMSLQAPVPAVSTEPGNVLSLMTCTVLGGSKALFPGPSMRLEGSEVFFHNSQVDGALGKNMPLAVFGPPDPGGPGGVAILVVDSRLFLDKGEVRGGKGGRGTNSPVCTNGGPGGVGMVVTGPDSRIVSRDSNIFGGPGGNAGIGGCFNGPVGQSLDLVSGAGTVVPGGARLLTANSPIREGQLLNLTVTARTGDQAWLALSFVTAPVFVPGQNMLIVPGVPLKLRFLGTLPGPSLNVSITAPFVPAALDGFPVHTQAFFDGVLSGLTSSNAHEIVLLSDVF